MKNSKILVNTKKIRKKQNMNKNYVGTYGVIKKKWRNRSYLFSKL